MLFADRSVQNVGVVSLVPSPPAGRSAPAPNTSTESSCEMASLTCAAYRPAAGLQSDYRTSLCDRGNECGRLLDKSGLVTARLTRERAPISLVSIGGNWTASWRPSLLRNFMQEFVAARRGVTISGFRLPQKFPWVRKRRNGSRCVGRSQQQTRHSLNYLRSACKLPGQISTRSK
jgi:hypothetical protein